MRNLRSILYRYAAAALYGVASLALIGLPAVMALTVPPTVQQRQFPTQQVHYARFVVNFNDCVLVSGTCSVKRIALPYNAFVVRGYSQITTGFNSGTTDTISLGTATTGINGTNIVNALSVHAGAGGGAAMTIVAANLGVTQTGSGVTQTGSNGGFDVYSTYTQTGIGAGLLPTQGSAIIVLEYFAPNDGSCVYVPMGSTSGPC